MKQVNFSHPGGFPLEQETLERLQTAYRSELYAALKGHLSIKTDTNYIVAQPTTDKKGWAIIHQEENGETEGILYPIENGTVTGYLKTTRTGAELIFGNGTSQNAYFDYEAKYINSTEYNSAVGVSQNNDALTVYYYDLGKFKIVKDVDAILKTIDDKINELRVAIEKDIDAIETNISEIKTSIVSVKTNLENSIGDAKASCLHTNGDNAMTGYLQLTKVDASTGPLKNKSSLLLIDDGGKVIKSEEKLDALIDRIKELEKPKPVTTVPIGMIAIWGKAGELPPGWYEYEPLKGRMPVGLKPTESGFGTLGYENGAQTTNFNITIPITGYGKGTATDGGISGQLITSTGLGEIKEFLESVHKAANTVTTNSGNINIMNPYRVVMFIQYLGIDDKIPDAPFIKTSSITSSTVTLSWATPNDNIAVTNYLVFKNGEQLAALGNVNSYSVTGLTASTTYTFTVYAKDAAGNTSLASKTVTVTTVPIDNTAPTKPILNQLLVELADNNTTYANATITLTWSLSTDNVAVKEYQIWRSVGTGTFSYLTSVMAESAPYDSDNINVPGEYSYQIKAIDAAGNTSLSNIESTHVTLNKCFDVESLVTMVSGQSKKLKNITIGDKVQGFSFPNEIDESDGNYMLWKGKLSEATKTVVTVVNKKTSVQPNYYEIKTEDTTIKVTGEHPLLVTQDAENLQWVRTKNLLQSMLLIDKTGKIKAIDSITFKEEPLEVALLDVESVDNYVISGIVAHNIKLEQVQQ